MAILKGMWASIAVDGKSLVEYDEDASETSDTLGSSNTIVKYVEATSGAHFKIEFGWNLPDPEGCEGLCHYVNLDGKNMDSAVSHFKYDASKSYLDSVRACVSGQWTREKFRFAEIVSDDGQSGSMRSSEASDIAGIGKIVLSVCRIKNIQESTTAPTRFNLQARSTVPAKIPEKALKGRALSHKTSLDPPEKTAAIRTYIVDYVDKRDSPYVNFEFRYRSRRALQIEGIIPRSPSPVPLEDRPVESLTREEALELLARRNAQNKPETKGEGSVRPRVKRERDAEVDEILASSYVRKKARGNQVIEVIDLLDD
ncbi:hypothetical protein MMC11_002240 [Xylographa trunciseda]|nr:hypothetical protein [Xylographa trunciseda]